MNTAQLKTIYAEQIAPALMKQFNYSSAMQIPVLKKIVVNQGLGDATQDKKIIDVAINELSAITGQKAVATYSKKDIANFKLYYYGEGAVKKGDVNEDGTVNINDVVAIINVMAGTANWPNANVNGDPEGAVDINDVVAVINIMAGN